MPLDIYAALGALVRAEAARDRERRAAARPDTRRDTAPDRTAAPDAPPEEPRGFTERRHE
ncbi:hypothetical protein [Streptomyces sp. NPDC026673]|uniref:hypothetical protein n=1 Tax=Streptomyces sp. NPDC026673 TaxID=3155724 RepID=UPI0033C2C4D6